MPIYEYQCQKCGKVTEQMGKFTDPSVGTCPHCRGKMRRLLSSAALVFKGTGWYVTDYAGKGSRPRSETASSGGDKNPSAEPSKTLPVPTPK